MDPEWMPQGPLEDPTEVDTRQAVSFEIEAMPGSVVFSVTAEDEQVRMVLDVPLAEATRIREMWVRAVELAGG